MLRRVVAAGFAFAVAGAAFGADVPVVEVEEDVYAFADAKNGAGPLWCFGSTCLVRAGDRLYATGLETIPGAKPLNNCRWLLYERRSNGWQVIHRDRGRTREPAPLAGFRDGRIFVSSNPTLNREDQEGGGPAAPAVLEFRPGESDVAPATLRPAWQGSPPFTEHSYRSFAADAAAGELVLFQNVGYTHAEWAFFDRGGKWSANGRLKWPWGADYAKPEPIRVCYPSVALNQRAVHFLGVSDIIEPNPEWREFKRQLTGQQWDYDFRRLFYTWTPDITRESFREWVEIASREKTCGWIYPRDLWIAPNGEAHLLWTERAIDERLRARFFPDAKQAHSLEYAVVREGKVLRRRALVSVSEDSPGPVPSAGRFHVAPGNRLLVIYYQGGRDKAGRDASGNRVLEVLPDGTPGPSREIRFAKPFTSFFTATVRGGSPPSKHAELLGDCAGAPGWIRYARVRLVD